MYCKNCGSPMVPNAQVCVRCGVQKGMGFSFCQNCGNQMMPAASVCLTCGFPRTPSAPDGARKSKIAAGLLGIFLGGFGIHNFYLGYTGKAIAQLMLQLGGWLLTLISCGILFFVPLIPSIWGLVEGIMILCGSISTDANGVPLKE